MNSLFFCTGIKNNATSSPGFLGQRFDNLQRAALFKSFWRHRFNNLPRAALLTSLVQYNKTLSKFGQQQLVIVNYACGFNQSEIGKYFEWIIIIVITGISYIEDRCIGVPLYMFVAASFCFLVLTASSFTFSTHLSSTSFQVSLLIHAFLSLLTLSTTFLQVDQYISLILLHSCSTSSSACSSSSDPHFGPWACMCSISFMLT